MGEPEAAGAPRAKKPIVTSLDEAVVRAADQKRAAARDGRGEAAS
jgi:hypothetical protein